MAATKKKSRRRIRRRCRWTAADRLAHKREQLRELKTGGDGYSVYETARLLFVHRGANSTVQGEGADRDGNTFATGRLNDQELTVKDAFELAETFEAWALAREIAHLEAQIEAAKPKRKARKAAA